MLPINKRISAYNHYNYNNPKYIVIHYVGGQSSTAKTMLIISMVAIDKHQHITL